MTTTGLVQVSLHLGGQTPSAYYAPANDHDGPLTVPEQVHLHSGDVGDLHLFGAPSAVRSWLVAAIEATDAALDKIRPDDGTEPF